MPVDKLATRSTASATAKAVPTTTLKKTLAAIEKAVGKATGDDGKVDVAKLEGALAKADPGAKLGLKAIADAFVRKTEVWISTGGGGCGGGGYSSTQDVPATALTAREAKSVLSALVAAKAKAGAFDTGGGAGGKPDGVVTPLEAATAMRGAGNLLADKLAVAALQGAQEAADAKLGLADHLAAALDRASTTVGTLKGRDGSLSMAALGTALKKLGSAVDGDALFQAVKHAHERTRTISVSTGGCGGSNSSQTVQETPSKLTKSEATALQASFAAAATALTAARSADGGLTAAAMGRAVKDAGAGLAGTLVELVVERHRPVAAPVYASSSTGGC